MTFSIKQARESNAITDKELERFAVLFMVCCQDQIKIGKKNFEQAARDLGGTAGSFEFAYRTALKKLKEKGCYMEIEDAADAPPAFTPKKRRATEDGVDTPKKARSGKKDMIKEEPETEEGADSL